MISSVKSLNVYPSMLPVWLDKTAVGIGSHSIPAAEIIGIAAVSEHLPMPDISCIANTLFNFSPSTLYYQYIITKLLSFFNTK